MEEYLRHVNSRGLYLAEGGAEFLRLQRREPPAKWNPQLRQYQKRIEVLRFCSVWIFEGNISLSKQISWTMWRKGG